MRKSIHSSNWEKEKRAGLVVLAKFMAFTTELCIAKVFNRELNGRVEEYSHFELKNIIIVSTTSRPQ